MAPLLFVHTNTSSVKLTQIDVQLRILSLHCTLYICFCMRKHTHAIQGSGAMSHVFVSGVHDMSTHDSKTRAMPGYAWACSVCIHQTITQGIGNQRKATFYSDIEATMKCGNVSMIVQYLEGMSIAHSSTIEKVMMTHFLSHNYAKQIKSIYFLCTFITQRKKVIVDQTCSTGNISRTELQLY